MWPFKRVREHCPPPKHAPKSEERKELSLASKEKEEPKIVCETCGCFVSPSQVREVTYATLGLGGGTKPYCKVCKPLYDHVFTTRHVVGYERIIPAERIRVNEDGTPYKEPKKRGKL